MVKRKKIGLYIRIGGILVVLGFLGWFLSVIFEGEKPGIALQPLPQFISGSQTFTLSIMDMRRGLKSLKISVYQEGREIDIFEKRFQFKGLFNSKGFRRFETEFSVDPLNLNLAQGRVDLQVRVWDYSRRGGGDGNLSLFQHKMVVDTIPPAIRAISRLHYVNVGGAGLVVYQTSSDTVESGVFVNGLFFPGFPGDEAPQKGLHVSYFAVPHDAKANPGIYLWAKDRANNTSRANFNHHIRRKRFRTDKVTVTDRFLERILPNFSSYSLNASDESIKKFLWINRDLRETNGATLHALRTKTNSRRLCHGTLLRLKNSATMAEFADRRVYYYKGEKVDEQVHLGVDLASLANSEVQAGNHGRVIFADRLGIYGLVVVLDHGQGLASVYAHLSKIGVEQGQEVAKGEPIGLTGQTGLAGGDHLHFGVMVSGVFVNPVEWWDAHWIQDNITRKLALLHKPDK
jgi:murein DD-endopeptidase MepM/ murein hydrolase activator NlpD